MADIEICPICKKQYGPRNPRVRYHLKYGQTGEFIYACKSCNHAEYLSRHWKRYLNPWKFFKVRLVKNFGRDYHKIGKHITKLLLRIRSLHKEDISAVYNIFDLYWKDSFRQNLTDKIDLYFSENNSQDFKWYVATEGDGVLGVAGIRKVPERMIKFAKTTNPAEFYVMAVKEPGKGIGKMMSTLVVEELKKLGYTEIVFFSGETHKDSWMFYDKYAERAGVDIAPNGEKGIVWRRTVIVK